MEREQKEAVSNALDGAAGDWLAEGDEVLWRDVTFLEGDYAEGHFLAVDPSDGNVKILRTWISGGHAMVSVDLDMDFDTFSGSIDEDRFPHSTSDPERKTETVFRASLLGEHAELVWSFISGDSGSFIARTWKAGRDEHLVGGKVYPGELGTPVGEICFRQPLATLKQTPARAFGR